jgi:hypothetical protein
MNGQTYQRDYTNHLVTMSAILAAVKFMASEKYPLYKQNHYETDKHHGTGRIHGPLGKGVGQQVKKYGAQKHTRSESYEEVKLPVTPFFEYGRYPPYNRNGEYNHSV